MRRDTTPLSEAAIASLLSLRNSYGQAGRQSGWHGRIAMKRLLFAPAGSAFMLASCASTLGGNEAGGVVTGNGITMSTQAKFNAAQADCAKYGKLARVKKISAWDGTLTYEYVAKEPASS